MKLKIQARAKINWTLDVVGTLPNGYHDLDMLMQSVTLCDQMTMEEAPQLSLYVRAQGRAFVPADGNNLVLKAAAALQAATGCTRGARITLKKYIPVAAGMGGGSSDAAAALVGLNRLWGLGLSADRLEEIGLTVGADVPFCVRGGLQRAQGVGERLTPLAMKKPLYLVAFQPCRGLSTKDVFTALHEDGIRGEDRPDNEAAQRALAAGDVRALGAALGNVLIPFLLIIAISGFLLTGNVWMDRFLVSLRPAVIALVLAAGVRLGRRAYNRLFDWFLGIVTLVLELTLTIHPVFLILAGAGLGILYEMLNKRHKKRKEALH